jgi:hypothetical protein
MHRLDDIALNQSAVISKRLIDREALGGGLRLLLGAGRKRDNLH